MAKREYQVSGKPMADVPEALQKSLAYLIYNAHNQGVRNVGDSITLIVPEMTAGYDETGMVELFGYEVKISKEQ